MTRYYAARAQEYERIYQKPERQADLERLRTQLQQLFAGEHVFEVACGTGYWTEVVARSAASVLATDINEEVLAIARTKSVDPQKVSFERADLYALKKPTTRFTAGLAAFWWSHVPRSGLHEFLTQFHQVLAPGAKVVFVDNVYVEGSSTPVWRRNEAGDTFQLRRLEDGSTHEVLKNFPTEAELRGAIQGVATDVQVEFLKYYWLVTYRTAVRR